MTWWRIHFHRQGSIDKNVAAVEAPTATKAMERLRTICPDIRLMSDIRELEHMEMGLIEGEVAWTEDIGIVMGKGFTVI